MIGPKETFGYYGQGSHKNFERGKKKKNTVGSDTSKKIFFFVNCLSPCLSACVFVWLAHSIFPYTSF